MLEELSSLERQLEASKAMRWIGEPAGSDPAKRGTVDRTVPFDPLSEIGKAALLSSRSTTLEELARLHAALQVGPPPT